MLSSHSRTRHSELGIHELGIRELGIMLLSRLWQGLNSFDFFQKFHLGVLSPKSSVGFRVKEPPLPLKKYYYKLMKLSGS